MLILGLIIVCLAVGFIAVQQLDRRRWQRYQIERDIFFRVNPYVLKSELDCKVAVPLSKAAQKKLLNVLMLKEAGQSVIRKAQIRREPEQRNQPFIVSVVIQDFSVTELEPKYAEKLCMNLEKTDFFIGRPIELLAEITVTDHVLMEYGCRIKLNLPRNPAVMAQLIAEKQITDDVPKRTKA